MQFNFCSSLAIVFIGAIILPAKVAADTEVTAVIRKCNVVKAGAIFGGSGSGCIIYDLKKSSARTEISLCGGIVLLASGGLGVGVSLSNETLLCIDIKTDLKDVQNDDIEKALKGNTEAAQEINKAITKSVKSKLLKYSDKQLKSFGIDRKKLEGSKNVEFLKLIEKSDENQIHDRINQCPIIQPSSFPNS